MSNLPNEFEVTDLPTAEEIARKIAMIKQHTDRGFPIVAEITFMSPGSMGVQEVEVREVFASEVHGSIVSGIVLSDQTGFLATVRHIISIEKV